MSFFRFESDKPVRTILAVAVSTVIVILATSFALTNLISAVYV